MIIDKKNIAASLVVFTLIGCGGGDIGSGVSPQTLDEMNQKSVVLNTELNGYKENSSLSHLYETQKSQQLSDILFVYLLEDQKYFPSIAYTAYKQLSIGNLSEDDFNKQFVFDFATYTEASHRNIVYDMVQKLQKKSVVISQTSKNRMLNRALTKSARYAIPSDILGGKLFHVYSAEREFTLNINDAVSKASAKAGFFTLDVNLELVNNFLYTSSSQGDLKLWLEYPARQNSDGESCLCVHAEDSSGKDMGLSYYFSEDLNVLSLKDADKKCKSYPELSNAGGDERVCAQVISYLKNPVTGVCTEFKNSCEAQDSGWDQSCSLEEIPKDDTNTSTRITIGDVSAEHINAALIGAYKVALESNVLSVKLLDLAIQHDELADILLKTLQNGVFNTTIVPQLSQNKILGEKFLTLMKNRDALSSYVFSSLNTQSYAALMKSLMFSREASLIFSQILKNNPEYLAEGSALNTLIFSVNELHGEKVDNANEMLFTAMFSSSQAVKNMLDAVDALGDELKDKYLDFIFLGKLDTKTETQTKTQKYYNLSAIAEGMVVGMKAETGEDLFALSYTTKLVGYFLTSITPSKYLAYGKALYSAGTDYLAKVDPDNLALFKGALTNPVVQLDSNTTLSEQNTTNSAQELYGTQYNSNSEAVQASLDSTVQKEQVVDLSDYEVNKKATSDASNSPFFTFIPKALKGGSELVPTVDESEMDIALKDNTNASFFFLAPSGSKPDVGGDVVQLEDVKVQSSAKEYEVYKLDKSSGSQVRVDKTKDIHMIVVPW